MPRPPEFAWLQVDYRFTEAISWEPWLKHVAKTRKAFAAFIDYDPMSNETASCGVLSSAASNADLLSMTEYICVKKHPDHYGKRVNGRADLWIGDSIRDMSWAFEAKQVRCVPGSRTATFEDALAAACHDASRMTDLDADRFFGLLIATLPADDEPDDLGPLRERLDNFASQTDLACKVGGGRHPVYLFFRGPKRQK